jgi:hypothetical protein
MVSAGGASALTPAIRAERMAHVYGQCSTANRWRVALKKLLSQRTAEQSKPALEHASLRQDRVLVKLLCAFC